MDKWQARVVLALGLVAMGCAGQPLEVGRPALSLQGYRLAAVPAADAEQFLGRRYHASVGDLGDRPCGMPSVESSASGETLTAVYSGKTIGRFDAGIVGLLNTGVDLSKIESVRVSLTATRKSAITVPSDCAERVVYDTVAGPLEVEYRVKSGIGVEAATGGLKSASASYRADTERRVASVTLDPNLFVAYRVHEPPVKPIASGRKIASVALTLGLAVGSFIAAAESEATCTEYTSHTWCEPNVGRGIWASVGVIFTTTSIFMLAVDW